MKNTRKNKTKQLLAWPSTPYYTIHDLFEKNKHFNADITVRVKHTKAREAGEVAEIGRVTGGKGAPLKVYAKTPITNDLLDKAESNKIQLADNIRKLVNIISVTKPLPINKPVQTIQSHPVVAK